MKRLENMVLKVEPITKRDLLTTIKDKLVSARSCALYAVLAVPMAFVGFNSLGYVAERANVAITAYEENNCPYEQALESDIIRAFGNTINSGVRYVLGDENPKDND